MALQITDVQGNQVNVSHPGFTILRHDLFLELPSDQPPNLLIAPGRSSSIEFLIEHIGDASEQLRVEMDVNPPLPQSMGGPSLGSASRLRPSHGWNHLPPDPHHPSTER